MQHEGEDGDRGKPASFDRRTGEVSGSGAGTGNNPDAGEDYDSDLDEQAPLSDAEVEDRDNTDSRAKSD